MGWWLCQGTEITGLGARAGIILLMPYQSPQTAIALSIFLNVNSRLPVAVIRLAELSGHTLMWNIIFASG